MMLDKKRADDYALWRNVIYAIGNSCDFSKEGLEIAHEFSKQCQSKYGGVDDMYLSNKKKGKSSLTFGSIVHWLKEDGKDTKWLTNKKEERKGMDNHEANDEYTDKKKQFEMYNFKLRDTSSYGTINRDDKLIVRNHKNFKEAYLEMTYTSSVTDKNGHSKQESFVDTWFYDKNKRVYDKYDMLPPPFVLSKTRI